MGCLVFAGRFLQIHGSLQKRPASMDLWNSLSFAGLFSQMKVEPIKSLQVADLWVVSSLQVSLANKSGANQIITGLRLMGCLIFAGLFLQIHGSLQKRPASMDLWKALSLSSLFSQMRRLVSDSWDILSLQVSLAGIAWLR